MDQQQQQHNCGSRLISKHCSRWLRTSSIHMAVVFGCTDRKPPRSSQNLACRGSLFIALRDVAPALAAPNFWAWVCPSRHHQLVAYLITMLQSLSVPIVCLPVTIPQPTLLESPSWPAGVHLALLASCLHAVPCRQARQSTACPGQCDNLCRENREVRQLQGCLHLLFAFNRV